MRPEQYPAKKLATFLHRHKIATLDQLAGALDQGSERTVFRKLQTLSYLSSYSHRGKYYTLQSITKFDAEGLWSCRPVWFSRFGNLLETVKSFVDRSEAGYTAAELKAAVHVEAKHALVELVRRGELHRERLSGRYVYFCAERKRGGSQAKQRKRSPRKRLATVIVANPDLAEQEAKAMVLLFLSTLDERQRRLYAGLESLKLGYGGDHYIAELFGMDAHTVAHGRHDLIEGEWDVERLRACGGGRPSVKKKRRKY